MGRSAGAFGSSLFGAFIDGDLKHPDLYTLYLPPNARLESGGTSVLIRESGLQQLQNGQQFRVYTATNIPAGARLTAKLTNLPQPQSERNPLLPALMVTTFGVMS